MVWRDGDSVFGRRSIRYLDILHSRENVSLYWRGLPVSGNASECTLVGERNARWSDAFILRDARLCPRGTGKRTRETTRRDATHTRARAHVNENTPTRNTASLKARKKSQTRLNVDAGRQIFFVRDTNDRCICDDAIREIRRWKTQSGNQIVSNSSARRIAADEYADARGIESLVWEIRGKCTRF